jgi:hypothetical protein
VRGVVMSSEKFVVKISQVEDCTYRVEVDKLVITISTTDKSGGACIDAFVLVSGLIATLESMSRAREIAMILMGNVRKTTEVSM